MCVLRVCMSRTVGLDSSASNLRSPLPVLDGVVENERQDLREDVNVGIQTSAEALDHQHAEDHVAERSVLFDSVAYHRGEQFRHNGTHVHLRFQIFHVHGETNCTNYRLANSRV